MISLVGGFVGLDRMGGVVGDTSYVDGELRAMRGHCPGNMSATRNSGRMRTGSPSIAAATQL